MCHLYLLESLDTSQIILEQEFHNSNILNQLSFLLSIYSLQNKITIDIRLPACWLRDSFCSLRCLPSQFSVCLFVYFGCIRAPHYHCGDVSSKNFCPPLSIYLRSICVLLCFLPNTPSFFRGNEWLAVKSTCHVFIVDVTNILSLIIFQLISDHSGQHNSISSSWPSVTSSCGTS